MVYQFKRKSPQGSEVRASVTRQPFAEHSFGKPSSQSLSGSSLDGKESVARAVNSDNKGGKAASGSTDSERASQKSTVAPAPVQPVVRRLKYEMCKNWREKGSCKYGDKCLFAHGESELTKRGSA